MTGSSGGSPCFSACLASHFASCSWGASLPGYWAATSARSGEPGASGEPLRELLVGGVVARVLGGDVGELGGEGRVGGRSALRADGGAGRRRRGGRRGGRRLDRGRGGRRWGGRLGCRLGLFGLDR